ncbi:hypothetical protein SAMN06265182_0987 [Persephonella hydrogeniphila]|uniref:Uncharacterized protein n=1 Tax=Persephonella hydrogeniphila TaxID=198703 RepID=A0A285NFI4_9AQUI|nr:hypothetical protein [Persephonella hydrogeniphila]SNZ07727.1 hypothetical protein SAMN06265182_0987 [Persephonella hydrogeniphila]
MRQIVLEFKDGHTETFSPQWFMLSWNPRTNIATVIDKTSLVKRKYLCSKIFTFADEIRLIVIEPVAIEKGNGEEIERFALPIVPTSENPIANNN